MDKAAGLGCYERHSGVGLCDSGVLCILAGGTADLFVSTVKHMACYIRVAASIFLPADGSYVTCVSGAVAV